MDDLLREFLTETSESLDTVDNQLVKFEQDPNNARILDNIFRLTHTIKGTCGFLGLPGPSPRRTAHGRPRCRSRPRNRAQDHARRIAPTGTRCSFSKEAAK